MTVDDVVEGIFQRLCFRQRYRAPGEDGSMSLTELRLVLGVTEAQLREALVVIRFTEERRVIYSPRERIALGPKWLERCGRQNGPATLL
jgi:hypothetical protein